MSGPAKASPRGQVLVSRAGFYFFLRHYTFATLINKVIIGQESMEAEGIQSEYCMN